MLPPNEYVLVETQRTHRQELLSAAQRERVASELRPLRPPLGDRCLACVGRVMVRIGRRLEARVAVGFSGAQS